MVKTLWQAFRSAGEHRQVRRYLYAVSEVTGVALTSFACSVVFLDRSYRWQLGDPGMAKVTGLCVMFIGVGLVALSYCAKTMDAKVVDLIMRVTKLESRINE